jgi:hypothetical protein
MNAQQFKELHLIYDAVYDPELREQVTEYNNTVYTEDIVEVATEYFYSYGLNSDGVDILVEKVGLESFVEFVYDLSEDLHVLTEARRKYSGPSYEEVKAKIDAKEAAKKKAKESAKVKVETEKKKPETRGAESKAKADQPKSKAPVRDAIARSIFGAVDAYKKGVERHKEATKKAGDAYRAGVEKHSAATATAGKLAKETGKTVGKAAQVAGHLAKSVGAGVGIAAKAGKKLVPEEYDLGESSVGDRARNAVADQRLTDAQRDTQQSVDKLAGKKVTKASAHIAAKRVEAGVKKSSSYGPQRPKPGTTGAYRVSEELDIYDVILSHLLDEGYAESVEQAEVIMVNMSEEWRQSIVEATYKPRGAAEPTDTPVDTRKVVTRMDQKGNTQAWKNYQAGDTSYKAAAHLQGV